MNNQSPFRLIYMILCERAELDNDGFLNFHRVLTSPSVVSESDRMPELSVEVCAVVSFEMLDRAASWEISFRVQTPIDDEEYEVGRSQFGLVNGRPNLMGIATFPYTFFMPGLFRFKAYHGEDLLADYPLRVTYDQLQESVNVQ
jgi:hypothetical protein